MNQLYRTIVGTAIEPLIREVGAQAPLRQSVQRPLAQKVQGSAPSEPREAEKPITEDPELTSPSL